MMNLVALSLFVASLVAAGVFSPTPHTHYHKHTSSESETTIVKEGHRVVVVEYDEGGHQNTKISISPNDVSVPHTPNKDLICDAYGKCNQKIESAKASETAHEAARKVGDAADKVKEVTNDASFLHGPKELICDAYGKCKQKIEGVMGKAKDKASETTHEAAREVGDTAAKVKDAVDDTSSLHSPKELICDAYGKCKQKIASAMGLAKDKASETTHEAAREVGDTAGKVKEAVNDASFLHGPKELICDAYGKCKEKITGAMGKSKVKVTETETRTTAREVGDTAGKVNEDINDASFIHNPKELICDAYGNCKQKIKGAMGKARGKIPETQTEAREAMANKARDIQETSKESVEKAKEAGKKIRGDMSRNVSREEAKEAVKDIASYKGKGSMELVRSMTNILNLLGFATAYGLCVWVTFISSSVLSGVIPRRQFGMVQSKIYTVYFKAMAYSVGLALLGHILSKHGQTLQAFNLLASLLATMINSIYLEPRATKTMLEMMKVEKEEGRGREDIAQHSRRTEENHNKASDPKESAKGQDAVRCGIIRLNNKLKRLNSYSSFLNILSLMSLTWHLVYLAQLISQCS